MKGRLRQAGLGPAAKRTVTAGRGGVASLLLLLLLLLAPLSACAERGGYHGAVGGPKKLERYVLDFHDKRVAGQHGGPAILFLKKELMRQYPQIDVSDFRLRGLVLIAKTKAGQGRARLRTGPEWSGWYRVAGDPQFFRSGAKHTYARIAIPNPYPPSWGPWQLHLHGLFKIRAVILDVERRSGRRGI